MKVARIMTIARAVGVFALAVLAGLTILARAAGATGGKPDGQACLTNQSCSSGVCVNGGPPGSQTFGVCCTPTTCTAKGANCGTIPNGTCPNTLDCGSCASPNTCGGGGTTNVCGCTRTTCAAHGANCGGIPDNCGGTLNCGTCPAPAVCGGGGTPNVCCTPTTCAAQGTDCGSIPDGCGGTLDCGTCTAPDICGGGGTPHVCGCTPRTCADVGASSGTISDGCGGTVDCTKSCKVGFTGECTDTQICYSETTGPSEGKCVPKVDLGRACSIYLDCLSGCCCRTSNTECLALGVNGFCDAFAFCAADSAGGTADLTFCPGSPCGEDKDCPGFQSATAHTQFCTGGICRPLQQNDGGCQFSSGCFSGCCCTSTSLCEDPGSCTCAP